jgi:apolipoprotein N-acyltransferase
VFEIDEKAFIQKAAKLADDLGVYLLLSLYIRPNDYPNRPLENKVVMLDSEGQVKFEYQKSKPVPGANAIPGPGKILSVQTPFGRIGSAICYDMDFPGLIRQAGKSKVDLMLVPADDWKEINPIHTYMSSLRAIENGFSMVRSTKDGLSAAFDYQGRLVASLDEFKTGKKIMLADLPTKGTQTLYTLIGDLFAWLCLIGIIAPAIWSIFVSGKEQMP